MSDFCKVACTNYVACHTRLDQAVTEGAALDAQEKAWADAATRLPARQAELVLTVASLEFEQSLGELGRELGDIDDPMAELEEDWAPGDPLPMSRYADNRLTKAQFFLSENERGQNIAPKELADIHNRQERNTTDVVALTAGVEAMEKAEVGCTAGPTLDRVGQVQMQAARAANRWLGIPMHPEVIYRKHGICSSEAGRVVLDQMPVPQRMIVPFSEQ